MSRTLLTLGAAAAIFMVGAMVPAPASPAAFSLPTIQSDPGLVQPAQGRHGF